MHRHSRSHNQCLKKEKKNGGKSKNQKKPKKKSAYCTSSYIVVVSVWLFDFSQMYIQPTTFFIWVLFYFVYSFSYRSFLPLHRYKIMFSLFKKKVKSTKIIEWVKVWKEPKKKKKGRHWCELWADNKALYYLQLQMSISDRQ